MEFIVAPNHYAATERNATTYQVDAALLSSLHYVNFSRPAHLPASDRR